MSTSTSAEKCPSCGGTLPDRAPEGLCPKCLLMGAAAITEASSNRERPAAPALEAVAAAFPQLEILELIGQGGMGCVFKARQPQLNRFVALKILPESLARDEAFAARFTREAQALASLSHPNIVTIHDFGRANEFFFLLMEFVDGVNLRQALHAGRFTPEQALAVVPPICDALQFAHERGVVHRDIKPENLLLDKNGQVKIADFGIAKMVDPNHATNCPEAVVLQQTALGTPQYMAPEQRDAPEKTDHRADIYSLGVVLYELLTGELPGAHLQPPSRKVQVDVRLDEIVLRALETEPQRRYATAREFKTCLQTVAVPRSPEAPPPPLPLSPPKTAARRYAVMALGFLLTGMLGLLWLMAFSRQHKAGWVLSIAASFLALAFGFAGWRERLGKMVAVASLIILPVLLTGVIPWLLETRRPAAKAEVRAQPAVEAATESKRLQFEPRAGMANETSWSVHPKPSFLNSNGWAVMARMTLGGVARIKLPGDAGYRCDITLLKGDDDGITVRIDDQERGTTMTLPLRRDQPGEITLDGEGYRVLFPTTHVAPGDADTSHFAHLIVTPVVRSSGQPAAGQAKPNFGAVQKVRLTTNQFLTLPDGVIREMKSARHGSVSLVRQAHEWFIEIDGMHALALETNAGNKQWGTKSAAALLQEYRDAGFALLPSERFTSKAIQQGELPLTFLLPGTGYLQVMELNAGEQPNVMLRYKMVGP